MKKPHTGGVDKSFLNKKNSRDYNTHYNTNTGGYFKLVKPI